MKVLKLNAETRVAELAAQAFKLRANASARTKQSATAALLKANPHLADLTAVPKGTTLVVPDVAGLEVAKGAEPTGKPGTDLLDDLTKDITAARQAIAAAMQKSHQQTQETLRLARSQELQVLLKREHPAVSAILPEIEAEAKNQAEKQKTQLEKIERAFDEVRKDLKTLTQRLR